MGIFGNKITGVGTFFRQGLEARLETADGKDGIEKLRNTRDVLFREGIESTSGYKFICNLDEQLTSIETVFDFMGNSGGKDHIGQDNVSNTLRNGRWKKPKGDGFRFTYGAYELWVEEDKVYLKYAAREQINEERFYKFVKNCETIYNFLIWGGVKKARQAGETVNNQESVSSSELLYAVMKEQLGGNLLQRGRTLLATYEGREVRVYIGGVDSSDLYAQIVVNLKPKEAESYMQTSGDRFDIIGTLRGTCVEKDIDAANAVRIQGLLRRMVSAYEKLVEMCATVAK